MQTSLSQGFSTQPEGGFLCDLLKEDETAAKTAMAMSILESIQFASAGTHMASLDGQDRKNLALLLETYTDFAGEPQNFAEPIDVSEYQALITSLEEVIRCISTPEYLNTESNRQIFSNMLIIALYSLRLLIGNGEYMLPTIFRNRAMGVLGQLDLFDAEEVSSPTLQ